MVFLLIFVILYLTYNDLVDAVLGGLLIADEVVDIFIPVRFYWVRRARWLKLHPEVPPPKL